MGKFDNRQQPDLFNVECAEAAPKKAPQKKCSTTKAKAACIECREVFVSVNDVAARYNVLPSTIWRWLKSVPEFPAPMKLSPGTTRWHLSDLVIFEATRGFSKGESPAGVK